MLHLLGRRVLSIVPVLLLVSFLAFGLVLLIPGDPAVTIAGENASPEQVEATRVRLGLDRPMLPRYVEWLGDAVTGDLGTSIFSSRSVTTAIGQALPATLSLTIVALVLAVLIALPAGIIAAVWRGSVADRGFTLGATLGIALPNFWLGLMLILFFALRRSWFPAVGYVPFSRGPGDWLNHLILPGLTLGAAAAAETTRQLRGALVDVMRRDYVRTARAKGLRERTVVLKHALKNAAIPAVTVLGMQVSMLLGGAVVVEQVFGIPGLGQLAVRAVLDRDLPMIQGIVVVSATAVIVVNLIVDMLYGYLNPRLRR